MKKVEGQNGTILDSIKLTIKDRIVEHNGNGNFGAWAGPQPPPLVTPYHNEVSHSSLLIHIFPRERTYDNQRVQISIKFNTYEAYVV